MKKLYVGFTSFALLALSLNAATYYVSPTGNDTNSGTIASPFKTISKGLTAIGTGGLLYLRGGSYLQPGSLSLSRTGNPTNTIRIWAYPGEKPVIDSTGSSYGFNITGSYYYLKGLEQKGAAGNGIYISGNSNIVENCSVHDNGNTGLHMTGSGRGPSYNLILNCDSYLNYDPANQGGNADGFGAKWTVGIGNVFRGCRSYLNSDDGWDLWMASNMVVIVDCLAYSNGISYPTNLLIGNNGNGFKLGGGAVPQPHIVMNCVAFDNAGNTGNGFDENNNYAGQTLYNCTSFRNRGRNFNFGNVVVVGQHIFRNCISYVGGVNITSGILDHNSWQGFTVTDADFVSVDTSLVTAPRNANGSLPVTDLFKLRATSSMVDAGVDVGLPYYGAAPDLGAYECLPSIPPLWFENISSVLSETNGGLRMQLNGLTGHGQVVIYASGDLLDWQPIFTNPPVTGSLQFFDPVATDLPMRYYKAEER